MILLADCLQAGRCKDAILFSSAAERSGEVPRLSQGIHGKVAAGPALRALMGSPHGGMEMEEEEEQRRRRRPAIALGHGVDCSGRARWEKVRAPDERFRRSTRGQAGLADRPKILWPVEWSGVSWLVHAAERC